ncbi:glycosyltransferase family 9 protein [Oscillatoria sp. FACHB-1407]|uniref:glycosyltransferase family 9 protein n=1 Tax=Oscillatoria sp. FACHB-1407 TaxID=2692847 RepID=UPI0016858E78|nr:glycosyltransferase family 9 protein [Oscillatoria sp. FACHB-1407]MBD2462388.1 glycosyltransferase family 9 protein [Oscillatoria sp. FACHB-1407]
MRIVALVPGGIGDQILFFPTLDNLKQIYPDSEIDVVVEPRSKGAYRVCKSVNDTIAFDFKDRNSPADWANLLGVLRDRSYDVAIALGQRWAVGLLLWLTGIPVRVGYAGGGNSFLTNSVPLKTDQYAAEMYHDLLKGLGIKTPCPELAIAIPKRDIDWAETEQKRLGIAGSGYVLIHGGSSELAVTKGIDKIYPAENWQQIVQDFQQKQPDLPLVVVKGPDDQDIVAALTKANPTLKVTTPGDVGKLAAMIAGANLMLCTDSAPMHLAVALKVYTLALFGPTDPAKLLPVSDKFAAIKSPTGNMTDIAPATVLQKVWGG